MVNRKSVAVFFKRLGMALCLTVAAALLWWTRGCTQTPELYVGSGPSMEPTIEPGEIVLVTSPILRLELGELVMFRFVDADSVRQVLRRVAAMPGDVLQMQDGLAIVNGATMEWPFRVIERRSATSPLARVANLYTWGPWTCPPDSVLLLSDTRDVVGWPDSRFIGPVAIADLTGEAGRRLWSRQPGRLLRRLE